MEMTKVRNMFYKPEWFDGKSLDNGIDIYTRHANFWVNPAKLDMGIIERWKLLSKLSCSHAEMWFPEEDGQFDCIMFNFGMVYSGQMFTSTMRMNEANGNTDGIVMRPADDVLKHPERWWYSEFEVPKAAMEYSLAWCEGMVKNNKGYDKDDIWKFLQINTKKRIQDVEDGKMICSGAVWAAMFKDWEWCMDNTNWIQVYQTEWYGIMSRLFRNRSINLIMSPLLLAIWQYQAGMHFYECRDGSLII